MLTGARRDRELESLVRDGLYADLSSVIDEALKAIGDTAKVNRLDEGQAQTHLEESSGELSDSEEFASFDLSF